MSTMRYYDVPRHWTKKIVPLLGDGELNRILVRDFNKYTYGRWGERFTYGQFPFEFESCDWYLFHRGPMPRYWSYVKHEACHWLVNFNIRLASLAQPRRAWRIITSDRHSTVWDGKQTLFELNFLAFQISLQECFELAYDEELPAGEYLKVYYPDYRRDEFRDAGRSWGVMPAG